MSTTSLCKHCSNNTMRALLLTVMIRSRGVSSRKSMGLHRVWRGLPSSFRRSLAGLTGAELAPFPKHAYAGPVCVPMRVLLSALDSRSVAGTSGQIIMRTGATTQSKSFSKSSIAVAPLSRHEFTSFLTSLSAL
jgi:hypothetical protein